MAEPVLSVENLSKRYDRGFSLEVAHLDFERGRIYGVLGPNGSGKTTLLNMLALLDEPTGGTILYEGKDVNASNRLAIRRKMSMVMENPYLFRGSVLSNVALALRLRFRDRRENRRLAVEALRMVGLLHVANAQARAISRGEVQRVAIARTLATGAEVLILDEPFTSIDRPNVPVVEQLLRDFCQGRKAAVILSSHDITQAYRISDQVIPLVSGKIADGSLENLFQGEIEEVGGEKFVKIAPSVRVRVVTERTGKVHVSIQPEDIILSPRPLESSARNSFRGTITKLHLDEKTARVSVDVGVELTALITRASLEEIHLSAGSTVFLTFKATSVQVL